MSNRSGRLTRIVESTRRLCGWSGGLGLRAVRALVRDRESVLYGLFAALCTLRVATWFVGSMREQVAMLIASFGDSVSGAWLKELGAWSAPLDDVFIHFDIARATARGYPFEWSEGNGYSSGGTSWLYPLVLAPGYWLGFRQLWLGLWAMTLACVCVFALLWAVRRIFSGLPKAASYLAPPLLLAVGVLDWNLLSGMEVALYLGLWGGALVAWDDLDRRARQADRFPIGGAARVGIWGALLVATRPEGVTSVAVLTGAACLSLLGRKGLRPALAAAGLTAFPGLAVVAAQQMVNAWFTGDQSSAGAVAKLELYDPFLSPAAIWDAWKFHVDYQVRRITEHHLADEGWAWVGWVWWGLALLPLAVGTTRRYALILWSSAISWVLLVALNGQVRWQNERYAMPALAWLLLAAALGVGVLLSFPRATSRPRWAARCFGGALAVVAVAFLCWHQRPRFRDQIWFFGRASRNILEQHVRTGLFLREQLRPEVTRILVGDAGAITYAADRPGLDLIGLGGFRGLPFARAKRVGIPAALEILEHVPPRERPDVLAIYPSWWDALPLWFGEKIAEMPVHGNVICGGASKVIYRADWSALDRSPLPAGLGPDERVVDSFDFADLLSEQAHGCWWSAPRSGYVSMKLLPDLGARRSLEPNQAGVLAPGETTRAEVRALLAEVAGEPVDLWDAGRLLAVGQAIDFRLSGARREFSSRLLLRVAPEQPSRLRILVGSRPLKTLALSPGDGWQQLAVALPPELVADPLELRIEADQNPTALYHLWITEIR